MAPPPVAGHAGGVAVHGLAVEGPGLAAEDVVEGDGEVVVVEHLLARPGRTN